jgi:hypothetical protein
MANNGLAYAEPCGAAAKAEARKNAAYAAALRAVYLAHLGDLGGWGGRGCGSFSRKATSWWGADVARISPTRALWNLWDILEATPECRSRPRPGALLESCSRRRGHMGRGPSERALAVWLLARDDCPPTPSE